MTSTRPYHHGDLRAALLDRAIGILDATPDADLTLRGLARAEGVSAMAPYAHFRDKHALLDAIAAEGFLRLAEALKAAASPRQVAASARLARLAHGYVNFGLARPGLYRLMFGHRSAPTSEATRQAGMAAFAHLETAVADLAGPGTATRPIAEVAWAFVHGLTRLAQDGHLEAGPALSARIDAASRAVATLTVDPAG